MIIENAIHIEAAPDVVWAVTEDIEQWPKWTPTVTTVVQTDDGPFALGTTARIKQPGQPESEWRVTEFVRGERFTWETRRLGLWMKAEHALKADGEGTTNVLRLEATGAMVVLLWPVLRWAIRQALAQENAGLKAKCEALAASEA